MMQRYYFLLENMYRAMIIFRLTCLVGYPRTSAPEPKNGGGDMKVYQDSKGNINGYSWNISNKFIQTVVMGGCLLRLMLFPFVGLYLIFHPNEGGKYAFSRKLV